MKIFCLFAKKKNSHFSRQNLAHWPQKNAVIWRYFHRCCCSCVFFIRIGNAIHFNISGYITPIAVDFCCAISFMDKKGTNENANLLIVCYFVFGAIPARARYGCHFLSLDNNNNSVPCVYCQFPTYYRLLVLSQTPKTPFSLINHISVFFLLLVRKRVDVSCVVCFCNFFVLFGFHLYRHWGELTRTSMTIFIRLSSSVFILLCTA